MSYCDQDDIEAIYGSNNVDDWATVDAGDDASTKAARVTWACNAATAFIDDALRMTRYRIPLVTESGSTPTTINILAAKYAGVLLYEIRGQEDSGRSEHKFSGARARAEAYLEQVKKGVVKLDAI